MKTTIQITDAEKASQIATRAIMLNNMIVNAPAQVAQITANVTKAKAELAKLLDNSAVAAALGDRLANVQDALV